MRNASLALIGLILPFIAAAQTAQQPAVQVGDQWTYRSTKENGPTGWAQTRDVIDVTRVTESTIFFTFKPAGSTQPPKETFMGSDWSRIRDVNGKEAVVNRPLSFPLAPGKSWDLTYTEQHPNKLHKTEQFTHKYRVVGWESVEVPGGTFRALKIEAEGHWQAEVAPGQTVTQGAQSGETGATMVTEVQRTTASEVSGRTYKAFWYVPEVKRWVKSVEEYYSSGGVRNERTTMELESFKPAENARN